MNDLPADILQRLSRFAEMPVHDFLRLEQNAISEWFERMTTHDIGWRYNNQFSREDALDAVIGGDGDQQTDSICVFVNGEYVRDIQDLQERFEIMDIDALAVIVIQATRSTRFISNKMDAAALNAADLFEDRNGRDENERRAARRRLIAYLLSELRKADGTEVVPDIKFYYIACGNGWDGQTAKVKDRAMDYREKVERNFSRVLGARCSITVEVLSLDRYRRLFAEIDNEREYQRTGVAVQFEDESYSATVSGVALLRLPPSGAIKQGFIGTIDALQFVQLLERPDGLGLIEDLSKYNVRNFLTEGNSVNQEIGKTIEGQDYLTFAYKNNGVVIVADKASYSGDVLHLENYHIVNGLQTSNILYNRRGVIADRMRKENESAQVIVKIVVTEDPTIKREISRSSNRQTGIADAVVETNPSFILRLARAFDSYRARGVGFALHLEETEGALRDSDIPPERIMTRSELIRAVGGVIKRRPHAAAGGAARFYSLIPTEIFNDDHPLEPYLMCAHLVQIAEQFVRRQEGLDDAFRYHVAFGLFLMAEHHPAPKNIAHPDLPKAVEAIMARIANADALERALQEVLRSVKSVSTPARLREFKNELAQRDAEFTKPFSRSVRSKRSKIPW